MRYHLDAIIPTILDVSFSLKIGRNAILLCFNAVCQAHINSKVCSHLGGFNRILLSSYSKQPIFGLAQEWFRELSFSRLECEIHDRLHISSADWWDILLPLA